MIPCAQCGAARSARPGSDHKCDLRVKVAFLERQNRQLQESISRLRLRLRLTVTSAGVLTIVLGIGVFLGKVYF